MRIQADIPNVYPFIRAILAQETNRDEHTMIDAYSAGC